jgi:hypothetical protein
VVKLEHSLALDSVSEIASHPQNPTPCPVV